MTRIVVPAARCAALLLLASSALGCLASQADPSERQAGNSVSTLRAGSPASVPPAEGRTFTSPAPDDARMLAFAKAIGVECNDDSGRFECVGGRPEVGDYADIAFNLSCGPDGHFGIAGKLIEARDRIAPLDTRTTATLHGGELLCIQAAGKVNSRPYYYFVARRKPSCGETRDCRVALGECTASRMGLVPDACESGWVWAEDLRAAAP